MMTNVTKVYHTRDSTTSGSISGSYFGENNVTPEDK
jgi:hypothetical protein